MDKLLETNSLPELINQIENVNRAVISEEIELVIINLPTNKSPGPGGSLMNSTKH